MHRIFIDIKILIIQNENPGLVDFKLGRFHCNFKLVLLFVLLLNTSSRLLTNVEIQIKTQCFPKKKKKKKYYFEISYLS